MPSVGSAWAGRVICFKSRPLACTLLAAWAVSYTDPWLILTDLAPEQADVCWYSLRAWMKCGFKDTKRGGWQWQQTKIVEPARAARLWLAIAVATLWVLSVGGEADDNLPVSTLADLPATHIAGRRTTQRSQPRLLVASGTASSASWPPPSAAKPYRRAVLTLNLGPPAPCSTPVALYLAGPGLVEKNLPLKRRAGRLLDAMQGWLERNSRVIVTAVLLIFGVWLLGKGIAGLIG